MAKKTRVLVMHALHVLDKTNYMYVMEEGVIVEEGTFMVRAHSLPSHCEGLR